MMVVKAIWRVHPTKPLQEAREKAEQYGTSAELFHGTSVSVAEKICKMGFKIPNSAGMFGRGLYFARCPLKSVQYTKKDDGWTFSLRKRFLDSSGPTDVQQAMLLCDVYLGRIRTERNKCNIDSYKEVESSKDLGPMCFDLCICPYQYVDRYLCCKEGYDSLYAPGGSCCWNTVRVSEFVVYEPCQAIPMFIVEFEVRKTKFGAEAVGEPVAVVSSEMAMNDSSSDRPKDSNAASQPLNS